MEDFRKPKKESVFDKHAEHGQAAFDDEQERRADQILAGQKWDIAPGPDRVISRNDENQPVDPMEISESQSVVAAEMLGDAELKLIEPQAIRNEEMGQAARAVNPPEPNEQARLTAEEILNNPSEENIIYTPTGRITEVAAKKPLKKAAYEGDVSDHPLTTPSINRPAQREQRPPAPKTRNFLQRLFGG